MLTRLAQIYGNVDVLKIATSGNCELFAMSGERNPYKEATLGVLREGAWGGAVVGGTGAGHRSGSLHGSQLQTRQE
jgi:hypothetical protein